MATGTVGDHPASEERCLGCGAGSELERHRGFIMLPGADPGDLCGPVPLAGTEVLLCMGCRAALHHAISGTRDAERLIEILDNFFLRPDSVIGAAASCLPTYRDHYCLASAAVATALFVMRLLAQQYPDRIHEISNVTYALIALALARQAETQLRPGGTPVH